MVCDCWIDPDFFVGRKREIRKISDALKNKKIVNLWGIPGIGKTSISTKIMEYMGKHEDILASYTSHHVFESFGFVFDYRKKEKNNYNQLLVLDDADYFTKKEIEKINHHIDDDPKLRFLVVSRTPVDFGRNDQFTINLQGLSSSELEMFYSIRGHKIEEENLKRIIQLSNGNPMVASFISSKLYNDLMTWEQIVSSLNNFEFKGILGPDGKPINMSSKENQQIVVDISDVNEEIINILKSNPSEMYKLTPERFEEIIAEILNKMNYDVSKTPYSKDGGFDILAAKKNELGSFLYIVECKRYTPPTKVGVNIIRELFGVLQDKNATAGLIVTSSYFTRGAQEFYQKNHYRLSLHDYVGVQNWLKTI